MTKKIHGRHGARWLALQGLYDWGMSQRSVSQIEMDLLANEFYSKEFFQENPIKVSCDKSYLHELLVEVTRQKSQLDEMMQPYLDRKIQELSPVEHALLRLSFYELKNKLETPYKVIINEAIELAKRFGAQDSHRYVNGVLDKAAQELRQHEK